MKRKLISTARLLVQAVFMIGLMTSLIQGFMNIWAGVLMAAFFLSIIAGNFYCGWICPFGSLQDWFGKLGSLFVKKKLRMPRRLQRVLQFSRYLLYGFLSLSAALGLAGALSQTSAFNANFHFLSLANVASLTQLSQAAGVPALICMGIYLLIAMFFDRPFCNYLCPDAVNYSLLSFMRVFTVRRDVNRCVGCNRCNRVCPMQIDVANSQNLRNANCINCMQCVAACPVPDTLRYGFCGKAEAKRAVCRPMPGGRSGSVETRKPLSSNG